MNKELQVFQNEQFGQVRITEIEGKVYFVANDIAKALGYSNPQKAIRDHCKGVNETFIPTNGGNQSMKVIPEGDIYRLIVKSKLPQAEKFELWVFDEVLPTIQKHGAYMTNEVIEKTLTDPDFLIQLATQLKVEKEKRLLAEKKIEEQKPLVEFAEHVSRSSNSIDFGCFAKLIKDENINIGRNRLFEWMRNNKFLDKNNIPYQSKIEQGLFEANEYTYKTAYGKECVGIKTLVTGKGQIYFVEKLRKEY